MRVLIPAIVFAAAIGAAVPSSAQGTGSSSSTRKPPAQGAKPSKPKKPPVPRVPIGARAYFNVDMSFMSASESFRAVTGSPTMFGFGGGVEVLNVWRHLFIRFGLSSASKAGEHVLVDGSTLIQTGFPVDTGLLTTEIGAGWRAYMKQRPKIALYVGGGILFTSYTQTSPFLTDAENAAESFSAKGYSLQGGVETTLSKWMIAAVEAQYRGLPNALGAEGVSRVFNETDLGGFVIRGMIGIRFKK